MGAVVTRYGGGQSDHEIPIFCLPPPGKSPGSFHLSGVPPDVSDYGPPLTSSALYATLQMRCMQTNVFTVFVAPRSLFGKAFQGPHYECSECHEMFSIWQLYRNHLFTAHRELWDIMFV
ncbi:zinc finger C2H2 type [Echinococcus multilocularis]|uniref:Zinc finger C2H2 type n=1 Tax=Echinococcus multilocularis TaxID=6211 RepID=A0A068YF65_ECHMU|nr:zinc finger C2H2 type [Echinococcus multilocularis]